MLVKEILSYFRAREAAGIKQGLNYKMRLTAGERNEWSSWQHAVDLDPKVAEQWYPAPFYGKGRAPGRAAPTKPVARSASYIKAQQIGLAAAEKAGNTIAATRYRTNLESAGVSVTPAPVTTGLSRGEQLKVAEAAAEAGGQKEKQALGALRESFQVQDVAAGIVTKAPPPPDKVVSIGTITSDKTGQRMASELGLETGDHFATILKDGVRINVPVSESDWGAYRTKDITRSQLDTRIRIDVAGAPTAQQEASWREDALAGGLTSDQNIESYVNQRFMQFHNLTAEDMATAGVYVPGVTREVKGQAVVVPPAGTLAESPEPGDKTVKVYNWWGRIIEVALASFTSVAQAKGKEQIEGMTELGILPSGTKAEQLPDGSWGYIPGSQVKAQAEWKRKLDTGAIIRSDNNDYITSHDFESLAPAGQEAWKRGGFAVLQNALSTLDEYKSEKGYNLTRALADARYYNKPEIKSSVDMLFAPETVKDTEKFIVEEYYPGYWEGLAGSPKRDVSVKEIEGIMKERSELDVAPDSLSGIRQLSTESISIAVNARNVMHRFGLISTWESQFTDPAELWGKLSPMERERVAAEVMRFDVSALGFLKTFPLVVSLGLRGFTPWKEEVGENVLSSIQGAIESLELPSEAEDTWQNRARLRAAEWIDKEYLPAVAKVRTEETWYGGALARLRRGEVIGPPGGIPEQVAGAAGYALTDMIVTIPQTILGTLTSSWLHGEAGEKEQANLQLALLAGGMLDFTFGRPRAIFQDPIGEGTFTTLLILGPLKIARLVQGAGAAIRHFPGPARGYITNTSIAWQADVGRVKQPYGMRFATARELVQTVEFIWAEFFKQGGKRPSGWKKAVWDRYSPQKKAEVTAAVFNRTVVALNKEGQVIGRATPFQETNALTLWHATPNLSKIKAQLTTATKGSPVGTFLIKPEGLYGGLWVSPQMPQTFMLRGLPKSPGGLGIRYTWADIRDLPHDVAKLGDSTLMKKLMDKKAREGWFEEDPSRIGIYPLFKSHPVTIVGQEARAWLKAGGRLQDFPGVDTLRVQELELELYISPGFKLKAVPVKWFTREVAGTASMKTSSMIGVPDARLARINASISALKTGQVELIGQDGTIIRQRDPVPHPTKTGEMHARVTGIIRNPKAPNEVLLVMDKIEKAYSLPGGRLDLQWWRERPPGGHTWKSALSNQLDSEVNITVAPKDTNYLGLYLGKVNEYALPGSRVFDAVASSHRLDPKAATARTQPKGHPVEIRKAMWWNGKTRVKVYPATYDILNSVANKYGWDMSKVSIYGKSPAILLKLRDRAFVQRVRSGKAVKEVSVKEINRPQLAALIERRNELQKGKTYKIKLGQDIELLWLASNSALKEGLGVPPLLDLYKAEARRLPALWDRLFFRDKIVRRKAEVGEAAVSSPYAYRVLELKNIRTNLQTAGKKLGLDKAVIAELERLAYIDPEAAMNWLLAEVSRRNQVAIQKGKAKGLEGLALYKAYVKATKGDIALIDMATDSINLFREIARRRVSLDEGDYLPFRAVKGFEPSMVGISEPLVSPEPDIKTKAEPGMFESVVSPEPITRYALEPVFERGIERKVEPIVTSLRETIPKPVKEEIPKPVKEEIPKPVKEEIPKPVKETILKPVPVVIPVPEPVIVPVKERRLLLTMAEIIGKQAKLPEGSIAYKKGIFWKWIPPQDFVDGVKPRTLPKGIVPLGADTSGGNSPYTTIQRIGESDAVVPKRISVDEGVVDSFITNNGTKIDYEGGGLKTDVGQRIPSPTQGMSIPAVSRPEMGDFYPAKSVSRLAMDKEEPPRKGERKKAKAEVEGISRPQIAEDTKAMVEGTYFEEPVRGLSDDGYLDEDKAWLESLEPEILGRKPVKRSRISKKAPKRVGHKVQPSSIMGGVRI